MTSTSSGGGPLSMEFLLENEQFNRAVSQAEKRLNDFTKAGSDNTKRVDKAMENLGATINKVPNNIQNATKALADQKAIIRQIEKDISETQRQINKTAPGRDRNNLQLELNAQKRALAEEKAALSELDGQIDKTAGKHFNFETRVRELRIEMAKMEMAGDRNTEAYRELSAEAAKLYDAYRDVTKQTQILAHDQSGFQGVISGIAGITGAFSAAQGAMGIFNTNNEKLMAIQTRVQSLMAITIGLQQVSTALNKDSAFQVVVVQKAKLGWAAAQKVLNTQLGISVGLSKALMVSGIGLLIAGIGALVLMLGRWSRAQKENAETQKQMQEVTERNVGSMAKEQAALESNLAILKSANATYQEKYEALKKIQEIAPQYNGTLTKEGELIDENTEAINEYIKALERSIYIKSNEERLEVLIKEKLLIEELRKEAEEAAKEQQRRADADRRRAAGRAGMSAERQYETGESAAQARVRGFQREVKEYENQLTEISKKIDEAKQGFVDGLGEDNTQLTVAMMNFDQLIVEWLDRGSIQALEEARRRLTTENAISDYISSLESARGSLEIESKAYKKVVAEINALKITQDTGILPDLEDETLTFQEQLKQIRNEYEMFYSWLEVLGEGAAREQFAELTQSGDNFLQYINRQIQQLEKKKREQGLTSEERQQLVDLTFTRRDLTGEKTELQRFEQEIQKKREGYQSLGEYIDFLRNKINQLNEIESEFAIAKGDIVSKELERAQNDYNRIFNEILQDTEGFEQKLTGIREKYTRQRQVLNEQRDQFSDTELKERLAVIDESERAEINAASRVSTEKQKAYKDIFNVAISYTRRELTERMEAIKKLIALEKKRIEAIGGSTEHLAELEGELTGIKGALSEISAESFYQVSMGLRNLSRLAANFNTELSEVINSFAEMTEGAGEIVSGAARASAGDLSGVVSVISGFSKIVNSITSQYKNFGEERRRMAEEIEDFNFRVYLGELDINELYRERLRLSMQIGEANLDNIRRQIEGQKELKKLVQSEAQTIMDDLMSQEYIAGYKDVKEWSWKYMTTAHSKEEDWKSLLGKSYEEIEELFNKGQLSEEAEELFRRLQKLKEEGVDIERMMDDLRRQQAEIFTGTTASSIAQSIADGFAQGKRTMEDFAGDFEKIMQNAILSSFAASAIEPAIREFYQQFVRAAGRGRKGSGFEGANLTEAEIEELRQSYGGIIDGLGEQFDLLTQIAGVDFSDANNSLRGAIKGVTEETAGKLEGYINAMRMMQAQQTQIQTNQLSYLSTIAINTGYNRHLVDIRDSLRKIEKTQPESLRAKGI